MPSSSNAHATDLARRVSALAPAFVVLGPLVLLAWCFWPGQMNADTIVQIQQADTGDYTNQHAPLLMALWRPFYELGFGPGWLFGVQLLVFGAGAYLVLRAALSRQAAALATALITLSPMVFGMLALIGRDVWFVETLMLSFGCLVRWLQEPERRRRWLVGAVIAAWLAMAARQNAGPSVIVVFSLIAAVVLADRLARRPGPPPLLSTPRRRLAGSIVAGGAITALVFLSLVVGGKLVGVRDVDPDQYLYVYDLAALSHADGENHFPREVDPGGIAEVERKWDVDSVNPFFFLPGSPLKAPLPPDQVKALRDRWLERVSSDPLGYLTVRTEIFLRQIGLTRKANFIYHPAIDPNAYGYATRFAESNRQARDYVEGFADDQLNGGILFTIWVYVLIGIVSSVVLLRTRRAPLVAVGLLGVASLTYQGGLFLGAMGTQYRLEYPAVVIALLCGVTAVAAVRQPHVDSP